MEKNIYQIDHTQKPRIFELIMSHKNEEAIKHLEEHPNDLSLKGWMDHTPLHKAAECGNTTLVQYLIGKGVDVNARRSGVACTPLSWAVNIEVATQLLEAGATIDSDELDRATRDDRVELIEELLKRGAQINSSDPEFLNCTSVKALEIYIKYGVDISLTDNNLSTILHHAVWSKNTDLFIFAMEHGVQWSKDRSLRTPFTLAVQGNKKEIVEYLTENYPELSSYRISEINDLSITRFDTISFFNEHPRGDNVFFALTQSQRIIKYEISNGVLVPIKAIRLDILLTRNFTFNKQNDLVIPTACNTLLIVSSDNLEEIASINTEGFNCNQITFLPHKEIYMASTDQQSFILDMDFQLLAEQVVDDNIIIPTINSDETLVSLYSYDHECYHALYNFTEDMKLSYVESFEIEWEELSQGLGFNTSGDLFVVSYPKTLNLCRLHNNDKEIIWSVDISNYKSKFDISDVAFLDEEYIVLGKGKNLVLFSAETGEITSFLQLQISDDILEIRPNMNGSLMLVRTKVGITPVNIEELKRGSFQELYETPKNRWTQFMSVLKSLLGN